MEDLIKTIDILTLAAGALIAYLLLRVILHIAYKRQLFDYIDGRKVHNISVPRLGGIAFVPTIALVMIGILGIATLRDAQPFLSNDVYEVLLSLAALLFIYIEGMADDLMGVGYKLKFLCQFLCAAIVISSGVCLTDFSGFLGLHVVSLWTAIPFTALLLVFIINALNLIDGIDGLSSGLTILSLLFFGLTFSYLGSYVYAALSFAALGAILPFFYFNVFGRAENRRKIFMGDCGSQTLGLVLGILAVRLSMSPAPGNAFIPAPLVISFSLMIVPCLDTIRVMFGRIRRHRGPFHPDKTHIHHKFLALGFSHRGAMLSILAIALAFDVVNYGLFLLHASFTLIVVADFLLWGVMHITLNRTMRRRGCINYFDELENGCKTTQDKA